MAVGEPDYAFSNFRVKPRFEIFCEAAPKESPDKRESSCPATRKDCVGVDFGPHQSCGWPSPPSFAHWVIFFFQKLGKEESLLGGT